MRVEHRTRLAEYKPEFRGEIVSAPVSIPMDPIPCFYISPTIHARTSEDLVISFHVQVDATLDRVYCTGTWGQARQGLGGDILQSDGRGQVAFAKSTRDA